jgi:molybdopterin-synthase adenylyltransferase
VMPDQDPSRHTFTPEELDRYARHIVLPQVGGKGQQKLLASSVAVIGAGGLGSPVIAYLAAAGVGRIVIIDDDIVATSNLQRQILHDRHHLGRPKVESARHAVDGINPGVKVITHRERLNASNAAKLLGGVDVVVDGSDNFATRYLVNDVTFAIGVPLVSGAMFRFEGQVTVFPQDRRETSPCYRCLFSKAPEPGLVPSCSEAGILGVVPGVVGSIQATEVLKLLLGIGTPLIGRLLTYDALEMNFRVVEIKRNRRCILNGDEPTHPLGAPPTEPPDSSTS